MYGIAKTRSMLEDKIKKLQCVNQVESILSDL
jgi:hypothetical protein